MSALREIAAHFGVEFDPGPLEKGDNAVVGMVEKLKGLGQATLGAFAVKEIFEYTVGLTEQADALAKQADAMGMSLAQLQEWNYVAMMAGVSGKMLTGVMNRITMGKAKIPADLKVSLKEADGSARSASDVFEELGGKIASIEDPVKRTQTALKVFGKQGLKLLPIFADGADGIRELREEFRDFGGGFDDDFAKQSDAFGDNIDRTKTIFRQMGIILVGKLLPSFLKVSASVVKVVKPMILLLKESRFLEAALATLAFAGVMKLSSAMGGLGSAMNKVLFKILPLVVAFLLLEDAIGFLSGDD